jgi:hypothetical protein
MGECFHFIGMERENPGYSFAERTPDARRRQSLCCSSSPPIGQAGAIFHSPPVSWLAKKYVLPDNTAYQIL